MNNYFKHFFTGFNRGPLMASLVMLFLIFNLQAAHASQRLMTIYVGIDTVNNTAYAYDENFVQLPDYPNNPKTSLMLIPENNPLWYVGSNIDVVRRNNDGSIDTVSDDPAYSEMVHHLVWVYRTPKRTRDYTCGAALLVPVGSELSNFHFPKGYAYKLDSGGMIPIWHWENPANIATTEKIFLRFNFIVDDVIGGYKDTDIDWVDAAPCVSGFTIPPGKSKKVSPKKLVTTDRRIIAVIPHIHDHGETMKLKSSNGTLVKFKPEYQNIPVAHDDRGQGPTLLHSHPDHLPVNGLYNWTPGQYGPIIKAGESLWVETEYKNPHEIDIDNMLIAFIFWEKL